MFNIYSVKNEKPKDPKKDKTPVLSKKEREEAQKESDKAELLLKMGQRLRRLRIKKGFTNYEHFAYDNGFNRAQYGRYERGYDLKISTLNRLVKAFGITLEEFFSKEFD